MGLKRGLLVAILFFALIAKADDTITPLTLPETNIRIKHFDTVLAPFLEIFELKLLQQHMSYLPINTPQYNEHYTRGIYFESENGKVIGYAVTGGTLEGSYWKFAFDAEVSPVLRSRMLSSITPFVIDKLRKLQSDWRDLRSEDERLRSMDKLEIRVDFLNSDSTVHRWILDIFSNYRDMYLEDTSKGKEIKISELFKNPSDDIMNNKGPAKIITGYQFGKVYSTNLKKMVDLKDGYFVVLDTHTGRTLGTITPPEIGTPKIKISSTQLVLDYGPGKKRYHYGIVEYKLLYVIDNATVPRKFSALVGGQCKDLFSF